MGINNFPTIKSYWSVDTGLGNPLIQKAVTRRWFLEILQNIHFADNRKESPPKDSDEYDRAWKRRPLFQASAYEACNCTRTPLHMPKMLETCKKSTSCLIRKDSRHAAVHTSKTTTCSIYFIGSVLKIVLHLHFLYTKDGSLHQIKTKHE